MRWNNASEKDKEYGSWPETGTTDLSEVDGVAAAAGNVKAQITRSILPNLYSEIPDGEKTKIYDSSILKLSKHLRNISISKIRNLT